MYVPLKITTDYSLLKSTIKIENLISFLSDMHITAAAIVDENLFGIMELYNSCIKNSIKPIIGLELTYKEQQIYCYAKNYQGYQNLLKLHTIKETREVTPADFDLYHHELKIILPFSSWNLLEELGFIVKDTYLGYRTEFEKNNAYIKTENVVYVRDIRSLKDTDTFYLDYLKMIDNSYGIYY